VATGPRAALAGAACVGLLPAALDKAGHPTAAAAGEAAGEAARRLCDLCLAAVPSAAVVAAVATLLRAALLATTAVDAMSSGVAHSSFLVNK